MKLALTFGLTASAVTAAIPHWKAEPVKKVFVASTESYTSANPRLCSDTTCTIVHEHQCKYNGANHFAAGIASNLHQMGTTRWMGNSGGSTCTGESSHSSMRIFHKNAETTCVAGHKCGIGLVTAGAACECRPECEFPNIYINGDCRSRTYEFTPGACDCANGSCDAGNTECAACDTAFTLRRVNTDTATRWTCVSMKGLQPSDKADAYKNCGADNLYSTDSVNCQKCPAGSYTSGGHDFTTRTDCQTCPAGSKCDGTSEVTRCPKNTAADAGSDTCDACDAHMFAAPGSASCTAHSGSCTNGSLIVLASRTQAD